MHPTLRLQDYRSHRCWLRERAHSYASHDSPDLPKESIGLVLLDGFELITFHNLIEDAFFNCKDHVETFARILKAFRFLFDATISIEHMKNTILRISVTKETIRGSFDEMVQFTYVFASLLYRSLYINSYGVSNEYTLGFSSDVPGNFTCWPDPNDLTSRPRLLNEHRISALILSQAIETNSSVSLLINRQLNGLIGMRTSKVVLSLVLIFSEIDSLERDGSERSASPCFFV